jgi:RNA polymerase sigma factor (sigma-70 family)
VSLLVELSKYHNEWLTIVKSFGEKNEHEDIVQEMYLKLNKYTKLQNIQQNGKLNKSYVWLTLRNLYYNKQNQSNKVNYIDIDDCRTISAEDYNKLHFESQSKISERIQQEIDSWHYADKILFEIYLKEKKSMRQLAKEIDISLTTVFWTIKRCKQRLLESVGEHYEDYLNGDYELI